MRKVFFALSFVLVVASGCNTQTDSEIPVAEFDLPDNGDVVTTAEGLRLVATLTDNTGILQYKLTISGIDELNGITSDSTISRVFVEGLSDNPKAVYIDEIIPLPDSTFSGNYRSVLECIDVEGNRSIRDTVVYTIQNSNDTELPQINVGGPNEDTLTIGNGFSPTGQITDNLNLIYATIYIGRVDGSDTLHWFRFPNIQDNLVSFATGQTFWVVDSTWSQGDYHIYCTAWDDYSGTSASIPFHVSY
jgi:hypothetical protein